jgi:hypothetical protein
VSGHWSEAGSREQARVRRARVRGGARCGAGGARLEQARRELMGRAGAERAETGGCGVSRCGVAAQERGHAGDAGSRAARAALERMCGRWNGTARPGPTGPATAWKRRSCAGQRRAERQRAAHGGVPAGRAQAATGLMCRKVARGAGRVAVRRLSHGNSGAAHGERRRPTRRRQRTKSSGTTSCLWRIRRWPRCERASVFVEAEGVSATWYKTDNRLGSFLQARACERQQATREQARGQRSGNVLLAAVVGRPGWHRSRRKGRQSYILCEQEWRTGDATRHSGPTRMLRGCADHVFAAHAREQWKLSCEQENPEVRGGVSIADQSGSIVSSQGSTTSSSSYPSLIAQLTTVTTGHREKYLSGHSPPTTIPWHTFSSPTESRHRQALLIVNPVHRGNSLSTHSFPLPRLPQGLP